MERESLNAAREYETLQARLEDLVGRTLDRIEVVPLGVMFHFGSKRGDNGVVYWAFGGPSS